MVCASPKPTAGYRDADQGLVGGGGGGGGACCSVILLMVASSHDDDFTFRCKGKAPQRLGLAFSASKAPD